jgi:hypothetical protein
LQNPFDVEVTDDLVIVADTANSRLAVWTTGGTWVGAFGVSGGHGLGGVDQPNGLDVSADGSTLYVADQGSDRITTWSITDSAPPPDQAPPDGTITAPTKNQVLPAFPVTISGNATDDVALASVTVAVQDRVSKRWWNQASGTWGTAMVQNAATLANPGATSSAWSYAFAPPAPGSSQYFVAVRAHDTAGKVDGSPAQTRFEVRSGPSDTVAPDTEVTAPAKRAVVAVGDPLAIRGSATDDVGVTGVRIGIQDTVSKQWWHADGSWGAYQLQAATLASPGATSTTWQFTWTPPAAGSYGVQAAAVDAAGNIDGSPVWQPFSARS